MLIFYRIYTRRMMLLAQETRRGELYPMLILHIPTFARDILSYSLRTLGLELCLTLLSGVSMYHNDLNSGIPSLNVRPRLKHISPERW